MKETLFFILYILFSFYISFLDIKTGQVPRLLLWGAVVLALVYQLTASFPPIPAIIGGLSGTGLFLLAYYISGKKLGLADAWYAGLIGIVFGPFLLAASLGISCILGAVFILVSKNKKIPFIPFMAAGSFSLLPVVLLQQNS